MRWFIEVSTMGGPVVMWIFVCALYIGMSSVALFAAPLKQFHRFLVAGTIGAFSLIAVVLGLVAHAHAMRQIEMAILAGGMDREAFLAIAREQAAMPRDFALGVALVGVTLAVLGCVVGGIRERKRRARLGIAG